MSLLPRCDWPEAVYVPEDFARVVYGSLSMVFTPHGQGLVVQKPVNPNLGLKVNRCFCFSC